jgi:hypothetical protein
VTIAQEQVIEQAAAQFGCEDDVHYVPSPVHGELRAELGRAKGRVKLIAVDAAGNAHWVRT